MAQRNVRSPRPPVIVGDYVIGRTVGEGSFAKVKLGTHQKTREKVAVKILEKEKVTQSIPGVQQVIRELQNLKLLRHPHIIHLYEIIETDDRLYLIMEYADGGELFTHISERTTRIPEQEAVCLFRQIISGVDKIHRMNVVHRDMKPENMLLDAWNNIKIADFGLSHRFTADEKLNTSCGSPCYAPPEMILGNAYVPQLCDVWSVGVTLFALICGYLPFENPSTSKLYGKILTAEYECPSHVSKRAQELLSKILEPDPALRYNIERIKRHRWFKYADGEKSSDGLKFFNFGCGVQTCRPCCNWYRPGCSVDFDEDIIQELLKMGFNVEETTVALRQWLRIPVTASYYLLLKRKTRIAYEQEANGQPFTLFDKNGQVMTKALGADSAQYYSLDAGDALDGETITGADFIGSADAQGPKPSTPLVFHMDAGDGNMGPDERFVAERTSGMHVMGNHGAYAAPMSARAVTRPIGMTMGPDERFVAERTSGMHVMGNHGAYAAPMSARAVTRPIGMTEQKSGNRSGAKTARGRVTPQSKPPKIAVVKPQLYLNLNPPNLGNCNRASSHARYTPRRTSPVKYVEEHKNPRRPHMDELNGCGLDDVITNTSLLLHKFQNPSILIPPFKPGREFNLSQPVPVKIQVDNKAFEWKTGNLPVMKPSIHFQQSPMTTRTPVGTNARCQTQGNKLQTCSRF